MEPPQFLTTLASGADARSRTRAWGAFVEQFSDLIMHVARSLGGGHDDVMDRYVYVLEQLRRDEYRKLVGFVTEGRGRFETWLTFVARNLCHDAYRRRYGRLQSGSAGALEARSTRRRLADLVAVEIETFPLEDSSATVEQRLRATELARALETALCTLDTHERLLLKLRFEDELSVPQVARATGHRNPFEVYRKLDKIFEKLRVRLHHSGVDSSAP